MHPYRGWPFLSDPRYPLLSALWAIVWHGALSVLVIYPLLSASSRPLLFGALAAFGGIALDLDHVVAAGSLAPSALEHLAGGRPGTHSLLAAVLAAALIAVLSRNLLVGWCVLAVLLAHLLPDAAGGGERWLYPLRAPDSIPWLFCPLGLAVTLLVSAGLAQRLCVSQRTDQHRAAAQAVELGRS